MRVGAGAGAREGGRVLRAAVALGCWGVAFKGLDAAARVEHESKAVTSFSGTSKSILEPAAPLAPLALAAIVAAALSATSARRAGAAAQPTIGAPYVILSLRLRRL